MACNNDQATFDPPFSFGTFIVVIILPFIMLVTWVYLCSTVCPQLLIALNYCLPSTIALKCLPSTTVCLSQLFACLN